MPGSRIRIIPLVFLNPKAIWVVPNSWVCLQTATYSIVAVGIVILYSVGFWLISARKWFTGPVKQIAAEEMGIDVMEPGTAEKFEEMEREKVRNKGLSKENQSAASHWLAWYMKLN
ncbi:hypothetical protein MPER_11436 [Moniliophthora perniciosa FA553]|nr:hypothetical protein MPER_11436 [Moniliophthora perniciosa FA553]